MVNVVQARLRRKAHKLAKQIGCKIDIDRQGGFGPDGWITYWVFGPAIVYGNNGEGGPREDPREGDHICLGWDEVIDAIEAYRVDVFMHQNGIDADTTKGILRIDEMGFAWRAAQDKDPVGLLVLADWLEENGRSDLAGPLRE